MMDLFGVPPHITTQPGSRTVARGASASLTVKVLGYLPLTYRWQKDGTDIAGATTASYTLDAVAEDDRGAYRCVIGNRFGSATSAAATLTVTK
ncbi:MAG: immunoglobulin domain-containing protein [Armatimonadetes bacterium]|nr:immunoglobulin domain-containing protein [Armatimonadota bacterium]